MTDFLKETVYTGVGFVALTAEKLQEKLEELNADLVEQTKASKEEGQRIVDEWIKEFEERRDGLRKRIIDRKNELTEEVEETVEEFTDKVKETTSDIAEAINIPTKDDVDELTEAVEKLEKKVASKPAPKRAKRVTANSK